EKARLGDRRDDCARPGRNDGVVAALSRTGRHRPDRGCDQQSGRRRRRLPAEAVGERRGQFRGARRAHHPTQSRRGIQRQLPALGFNPGEAVDRAIGHVVELQRSDGSFGVWTETEETVPWLDAYATDFLLRAKEHGKNVPDYALNGALAWLRDYVRQEHREKK